MEVTHHRHPQITNSTMILPKDRLTVDASIGRRLPCIAILAENFPNEKPIHGRMPRRRELVVTDATAKDAVAAGRDDVAVALVVDAGRVGLGEDGGGGWGNFHAAAAHEVLDAHAAVLFGESGVSHDGLDGAAAGGSGFVFDGLGWTHGGLHVFVVLLVALGHFDVVLLLHVVVFELVAHGVDCGLWSAVSSRFTAAATTRARLLKSSTTMKRCQQILPPPPSNLRHAGPDRHSTLLSIVQPVLTPTLDEEGLRCSSVQCARMSFVLVCQPSCYRTG